MPLKELESMYLWIPTDKLAGFVGKPITDIDLATLEDMDQTYAEMAYSEYVMDGGE